MKSTIRIDVSDLRPVIVVEEVYSEDLRDKFVCSFFEQLAHISSLCFVGYKGRDNVSDGVNPPKVKDTYILHPIPGNKEGIKKYLSECSSEQVRLLVEIGQELISSYQKNIN